VGPLPAPARAPADRPSGCSCDANLHQLVLPVPLRLLPKLEVEGLLGLGLAKPADEVDEHALLVAVQAVRNHLALGVWTERADLDHLVDRSVLARVRADTERGGELELDAVDGLAAVAQHHHGMSAAERLAVRIALLGARMPLERHLHPADGGLRTCAAGQRRCIRCRHDRYGADQRGHDGITHVHFGPPGLEVVYAIRVAISRESTTPALTFDGYLQGLYLN
jgi:hypothetical protein